MSSITLIGLGPGPEQHRTVEAERHLNQSNELYLRSALPPGLPPLPGSAHTFEEVLAQVNDPAQANEALAEALLRLGQRPEGVVYATPGHPAIDDPAFPYIRALAERNDLPLTIIPGLSLLEAARTALTLEAGPPLQLLTAAAIAALHHPPLSPDQPALIGQLQPHLLAPLQATLSNAYPTTFRLTLLHAPGSVAEQRLTCTLAELPEQTDLAAAVLYLPAETPPSSFVSFQEIIAHLRAPEGCPWDREQTHLSLRSFLLEETYEVLEALDAGDLPHLAEELGDLLLQIVLHTQIAIDNGDFTMSDVIGHISRKMLRRHPHVFGQVSVSGSAEVLTNWEAIKRAEKSANGAPEQPASVLDGLPPALPALAQTLIICQRVVRLGFEWPDIDGLLAKLVEEAHEITEAANPAHLEAEIGDFLFNAVNLARWYNVDPESALRAANARFSRRFRRVEALAEAQERSLRAMSLAEMQVLWREAKRLEG